MKSGIVIVLASGILALASPASSEGFARDGIYAGVSGTIGSYPRYEDELESSLRALGYIVQEVEVENAVGVKAKLGYRFHPRASLEAEFEFLPDARIFLNNVAYARHRTWALGVNGRAYALTGRFQPYGLVGLGLASATLTDSLNATPAFSQTAFAARFGGGLDIYATEHIVFALDLSYVLATGALEGLDFVSFGWGLQYRF